MTGLVEFVQNQAALFGNPSDSSIKWEKESQFAIQALGKNKVLSDTAQSNLASLQNAIINVSAIGISLNPANKHAYLVPRGGAVCLDISYMGLMHLAADSGSILWGQCKLVHLNDKYTNMGLDKAPEHKYSAFGDRGDVVGGYCTVKIPSGAYLTEEMSLEAIKKVQEKSKARTGPWTEFWDEMARKTIVKRASKYWPSTGRIDSAIENLNSFEGLTDKPIETEPETMTFTPDQKQYFDQLIASGDAIGMHIFRITTDQSVYTNLYNSFPKGQKGKYKEIVSTLDREGMSKLTEIADTIAEALNNNDAAMLMETVEELSESELNAVKYRLTNEQLSMYRDMT